MNETTRQGVTMKKVPFAMLCLLGAAVVLALTAFAVIDDTARGIAGGLALWAASKIVP